MVVVPLTSCVVIGQIKWRLMSERSSESGNKGGNFSQKAPSIHKGENHTNATIVASQHPWRITYEPTREGTTPRNSSNATNAIMREIRK